MSTQSPIVLGSGALLTQDIVLSVGSDNVYRFGFEEPSGDVYVPVNLSGWTAASHIRSYKGASPILLDLSSYIALTSGGDITVTVPGAATEGLEVGGLTRGVWDLELTQTAGGRVVRFVEGNVMISQDVTRVTILV